eukprot:831616_1
MAHLLLMCMIFVLFIRSSREAWIIGDSSLPRADDSMAVGAYNGTIFIIGGNNERNALVELNIATHSVTDHGKHALIESETDGAAQYWSQQGPIVYIIHEEGSICFFNIYDMRTRQYTTNWKGITFLTGVGDDGCLASSALFLYVTGGDPDGLDALQVLSLTTYSWITNPLPPTMQQRRQHHSCVLHNDYLWAFGGQWTPIKNQNDELASNERIRTTGDITQNTWNYINPFSKAIEHHRAVAYQDTIYVIGGNDADSNENDFVHLVDANTGEVTVSPDRMQSVSQLGAPIIVDSTLYVFGGFDVDLTQWQYYQLDTTTQTPTIDVHTSAPITATTTRAPTDDPTFTPFAAPTQYPSSNPSNNPSTNPTGYPSTQHHLSTSFTSTVHIKSTQYYSSITSTIYSSTNSEFHNTLPTDEGRNTDSDTVQNYWVLIVAMCVVLFTICIAIIIWLVLKLMTKEVSADAEGKQISKVIRKKVENSPSNNDQSLNVLPVVDAPGKLELSARMSSGESLYVVDHEKGRGTTKGDVTTKRGTTTTKKSTTGGFKTKRGTTSHVTCTTKRGTNVGYQRCMDCGKQDCGKLDDDDGLFYCNECWMKYGCHSDGVIMNGTTHAVVNTIDAKLVIQGSETCYVTIVD